MTKSKKSKVQSNQQHEQFDAYSKYAEYCTECVLEQDERDVIGSLQYCPTNDKSSFND